VILNSRAAAGLSWLSVCELFGARVGALFGGVDPQYDISPAVLFRVDYAKDLDPPNISLNESMRRSRIGVRQESTSVRATQNGQGPGEFTDDPATKQSILFISVVSLAPYQNGELAEVVKERSALRSVVKYDSQCGCDSDGFFSFTSVVGVC
jgi:hypothetical protein